MSIDVITLTVSKNYTDKQIEKAFIKGVDLSGYVQSVNGVAPDEKGNVELSGGNVAYDKAQNLTEEQKAQARDNIGAQPKGNYLTEVPDGYAKTSEIPTKPEDIGAQPAGNYLTEVPEGYAKTEDVPTDEEIIQLIKDNATEPVGGIDLGVTGATVGQTVKISAVDENGVPTEWEPVDFPSGGGGEFKSDVICDMTATEPVVSLIQNVDNKLYKMIFVHVAFQGVSGEANPEGITAGFRQGLRIKLSNGKKVTRWINVSLTTDTKLWHVNFALHFMHNAVGVSVLRTEQQWNHIGAIKEQSPIEITEIGEYDGITEIAFTNDGGDVPRNLYMTKGAHMKAWGLY